MIAFGITRSRSPSVYAAAPSRASAAAPSRTPRWSAELALIGSIFHSYNAHARPRGGARGPRGAGAACTRTPRSSTRTSARQVREALSDPERRGHRLRRRDRRAQHRLVGGLGHAAVVREPLRGARRRRAARRSRGTRTMRRRTRRLGEVDTLDGFLLVLSPWAVRNIRFDEALGEFHGYDLDFCLQVREAGRKVVTADFRAIHHRPLEMRSRPRALGRGAHHGRREVGRPHVRRSARPRQLEGARARAPRPSATRRAALVATPRSSSCRPRHRDGSSARCRDAGQHLLADDRAPAAPARGGRVIAFALRHRRARGVHPLRAAGDQRRRRARTPRCSRSRPSARSAAATTCCSTRARPSRTSRRSCSSTQDVEIADPDFCEKVRAALADPEVAVVGCAGATGVRTIAWWEGEVALGPDRPALPASTAAARCPRSPGRGPRPAPAEVDEVDGFLLVLSPWAVRNDPLRRVAAPAARLRRRLLPAGARAPGAR